MHGFLYHWKRIRSQKSEKISDIRRDNFTGVLLKNRSEFYILFKVNAKASAKVGRFHATNLFGRDIHLSETAFCHWRDSNFHLNESELGHIVISS